MEVFAKYPALSDIQFIKASDNDCKDIAIKFARELIKDLRQQIEQGLYQLMYVKEVYYVRNKF